MDDKILKSRHWIFLRGLVRGRGHWADFPQKFQAKFPKDSFEMIDLPGNGESRHESSPLAIHDYMQVIRSRSQGLQEGHKVHLLALSLGGMIAVEWMRAYPDEVEKSFLVCTSAANQSRFYERFRPQNYLKLLGLAKTHSAEEYEKKILDIIVNNPERRQAVLPTLTAYSASYPVQRESFIRQIYAAARVRFPFQKPGDVTVIGSYADRLVSPSCSLKIAHIWGVQPRMHMSAGHDIPIDDPDWLLAQLAESLRSN